MIGNLISLDQSLFVLINGLSGRITFIDELMKGLANDYFVPIIFCLILVAMWFSHSEAQKRKLDQKIVLQALISLGLANVVVLICNSLFYRSRPWVDIPVHSLLYRPGDSSLPSNAATVLFATAIAVRCKNRKVGEILLGIAAVEGFSRVYVGMHYPADIIAGALIGFIICLIVTKNFWVIDPLVELFIQKARRYYLA